MIRLWYQLVSSKLICKQLKHHYHHHLSHRLFYLSARLWRMSSEHHFWNWMRRLRSDFSRLFNQMNIMLYEVNSWLNTYHEWDCIVLCNGLISPNIIIIIITTLLSMVWIEVFDGTAHSTNIIIIDWPERKR